jgi:hypothetical protein
MIAELFFVSVTPSPVFLVFAIFSEVSWKERSQKKGTRSLGNAVLVINDFLEEIGVVNYSNLITYFQKR